MIIRDDPYLGKSVYRCQLLHYNITNSSAQIRVKNKIWDLPRLVNNLFFISPYLPRFGRSLDMPWYVSSLGCYTCHFIKMGSKIQFIIQLFLNKQCFYYLIRVFYISIFNLMNEVSDEYYLSFIYSLFQITTFDNILLSLDIFHFNHLRICSNTEDKYKIYIVTKLQPNIDFNDKFNYFSNEIFNSIISIQTVKINQFIKMFIYLSRSSFTLVQV